MKLKGSVSIVAIAAMLGSAVPAVAQNEAAPPDPVGNVAPPPPPEPTPAPPPPPPPAPAPTPAPVPPVVIEPQPLPDAPYPYGFGDPADPAFNDMSVAVREQREGFPWGILGLFGLLGLIGLFGPLGRSSPTVYSERADERTTRIHTPPDRPPPGPPPGP